MDEWKVAEKLARELELNDPGYVFYYLVDVREEYRDKYPDHKLLCLPGLELAVLPDGTTDQPTNVFKEDYPACREFIIVGGGCGG